jgi:ABC-2 family transporter protein
MIWVAWRQFRTQALVTAGLLGAFALLVIPTGLHLHDIYDAAGGSHCNARGDCTAVAGHDPGGVALLQPAILAIPALLGMFWGAPLVARELESGTFRLAWTQSVTRRRWLLIKVALVGVAVLAVAGLASWLVSWWFVPLDHLDMSRFEPSEFGARGIVPIGYASFAFGLGVAAGALARRTLPAIVATLLGFVAVRLAFQQWVRPHLLPARHALMPLTFGQGVGFLAEPSGVSIQTQLPTIPNGWALSASFVDRSHHVLSVAQLHGVMLRDCPAIATGLRGGGKGIGPPEPIFTSCLNALSHRLQLLVSYQPSSHYWPMQTLEGAIFLTLGLALIAATVWLVGPHRATRTSAVGGAGDGDAGPQAPAPVTERRLASVGPRKQDELSGRRARGTSVSRLQPPPSTEGS